MCLLSSASYNHISDKGLREMKPGLLKCKNLRILGYVYNCCVYIIIIGLLSSLRDTGLTGESGVHLKDIFEHLPKLDTVE